MFMEFQALRRASFVVLGLCVLGFEPVRAELHPRVRSIIAQVEGHYGRPVTITSGCRSRANNRSAGGAKASMHLSCRAADIRVAGVNEGTLLRFVKKLPSVGGVGTYCRNGIVHVDIGPKRQWHQSCGRRTAFKRTKGTRIARR
jgi:uncharacterized protein YcbK (DUF882 family)